MKLSFLLKRIFLFCLFLFIYFFSTFFFFVQFHPSSGTGKLSLHDFLYSIAYFSLLILLARGSVYSFTFSNKTPTVKGHKVRVEKEKKKDRVLDVIESGNKVKRWDKERDEVQISS